MGRICKKVSFWKTNYVSILLLYWGVNMKYAEELINEIEKELKEQRENVEQLLEEVKEKLDWIVKRWFIFVGFVTKKIMILVVNALK